MKMTTFDEIRTKGLCQVRWNPTTSSHTLEIGDPDEEGVFGVEQVIEFNHELDPEGDKEQFLIAQANIMTLAEAWNSYSRSSRDARSREEAKK